MKEGQEAMDEMKQLQAMCAAVPPADDDTMARARARVLNVARDSTSEATGRGRMAPQGPGQGGWARRRLITVPRLAQPGGRDGSRTLRPGPKVRGKWLAGCGRRDPAR